jgi:hypothetical protein
MDILYNMQIYLPIHTTVYTTVRMHTYIIKHAKNVNFYDDCTMINNAHLLVMFLFILSNIIFS